MYPPKLDKARKEWLASLKDGDEAVSIAEQGPPRLSSVAHQGGTFYECDSGEGSRSYSRGGGMSPANKFGPHDGGRRAIVPVTDELRRAVRVAEWRKRARRFDSHDWRTLTDDQIEAIAKILGWTS